MQVTQWNDFSADADDLVCGVSTDFPSTISVKDGQIIGQFYIIYQTYFLHDEIRRIAIKQSEPQGQCTIRCQYNLTTRKYACGIADREGRVLSVKDGELLHQLTEDMQRRASVQR